MIKKEIGLGLAIGLIANTFGFILCVLVFSMLSVSGLSFTETLAASIKNDTFGNLITLGAILNLGAFFLFLKQNKPYRARGVLLATLFAAIVIMISKFL
ncbi:hypothetical protein [Aquimarina intermedia]|uniref:Uncharacterized protein n=1 Tax=Aquimarina intermedia TaxID=350814 RepID=A0A5S5C9K6_9FLAO|nr:hypothetical protein [Aquimarina intermedia]TYP76091.1 hypothetical protein BD809_102306 [Aquimarina intermedia]